MQHAALARLTCHSLPVRCTGAESGETGWCTQGGIPGHIYQGVHTRIYLPGYTRRDTYLHTWVYQEGYLPTHQGIPGYTPSRVYRAIHHLGFPGLTFPFHCWLAPLCSGFNAGFKPVSVPGFISRFTVGIPFLVPFPSVLSLLARNTSLGGRVSRI